MDDDLEIINSNLMSVSRKFDIEYDHDEKLLSPDFTYLDKCLIKSDDNLIVIGTTSNNNKDFLANLAFEKKSVDLLKNLLVKVFEENLAANEREYLSEKNDKDEFVVSVTSVFPLNQLFPRERISISNLREAELDGLEFMQLSLPIKSAERLLKELKSL
jgi:hypothetical protein